jgi:hypothetical protein
MKMKVDSSYTDVLLPVHNNNAFNNTTLSVRICGTQQHTCPDKHRECRVVVFQLQWSFGSSSRKWLLKFYIRFGEKPTESPFWKLDFPYSSETRDGNIRVIPPLPRNRDDRSRKWRKFFSSFGCKGEFVSPRQSQMLSPSFERLRH